MTSVSNLLNGFRCTLTAADSGSTDATAIQQNAQQMLQEMGSLLNTQYAGSYLFGGGQTTNPPVDVSNASYPAMTLPSTASTSYYKGDDEIMSVRVSDTDTVSYGVTADNPAFEQALRALNLVANNSPLSSDALNEAMSLTKARSMPPPMFRPALGFRHPRSSRPVPPRATTRVLQKRSVAI